MYLSSEREERSLLGPTVTDEDPVISDAEVAQWLDLFGPVDEKALRRRPKPIPPNRAIPEPEPEPEEAELVPKPPASTDRENPELSDAELREWLALFGGEPRQVPKSSAKSDDKPAKKATPRPKKKKTKNPQNLNDEDLATWKAYFGQDE